MDRVKEEERRESRTKAVEKGRNIMERMIYPPNPDIEPRKKDGIGYEYVKKTVKLLANPN